MIAVMPSAHRAVHNQQLFGLCATLYRLGTTMFFGHNSEDATLRDLHNAGLEVRRSLVEQQDNEDDAFLWIEAAKQTDLHKDGPLGRRDANSIHY
jgi:hypothetical protein